MSDRRSGSQARPWLGLGQPVRADAHRRHHAQPEPEPETQPEPESEPDVESDAERDADEDLGMDVRLPPERPFAGDDIDTLDLLRDNARRREISRRRTKRVGLVAVAALVMTSAGAVIDRTLGGW